MYKEGPLRCPISPLVFRVSFRILSVRACVRVYACVCACVCVCMFQDRLSKESAHFEVYASFFIITFILTICLLVSSADL